MSLYLMVQQGTACPLSCFVNGKLYFSLSVQCLYEKASKGCHYIYSKCPHSNFTLHRVFILILGYNSSVPFLEEKICHTAMLLNCLQWYSIEYRTDNQWFRIGLIYPMRLIHLYLTWPKTKALPKMWLLPIQKNEAIIYKTYNINSLSYTLLPLIYL